MKPLRKGDLVADAAYAGVPRVLDEGVGRIIAIHANYAKVAWRDGTEDTINLNHLVRISERYEPVMHDSVYELPKFTPGTRVVLGNGDRGKVVEEVVGPTGFKSFKIKIDHSSSQTNVGRFVYATNNAMCRTAEVVPDTVATFYKWSSESPMAVIGCEIAVSERDQTVGLQKYSSLPSDFGMLFPYDPPKNVMFHMGNVAFPIDVIFVNKDGRVVAIEEQREPGIEEHWGHGKVSAVIEVNGGWCRENGITIGDRVRLATTKSAQEEFNPEHNRTDHAVRPQNPSMDPSRFKGRDTNDNILNSGDAFSGNDAFDSAHYEMTIGFDPTESTSDADGSYPTRPGNG